MSGIALSHLSPECIGLFAIHKLVHVKSVTYLLIK